ncbi:MAG: monovalent cation/H(+) antiporter subunit G [Firmicutes bacterium]|nr:monovalent cation/H(+) antiporter subunit G [Bacillota bacterium]MBQ7049757.1 monovalent cation/H(+) antiporter subunit G [Bacillota bacterium]
MLSWLQFILSAICIGIGLIIIILSVLGVYRFRFVLNRMHAAAMGDTLGILFIILGLMVANGFNMVLLKFLSIIAFMWIASPVSGHLITKLEYLTNDHLDRYCRFEKRDNPSADSKEKENTNGSC